MANNNVGEAWQIVAAPGLLDVLFQVYGCGTGPETLKPKSLHPELGFRI